VKYKQLVNLLEENVQ